AVATATAPSTVHCTTCQDPFSCSETARTYSDGYGVSCCCPGANTTTCDEGGVSNTPTGYTAFPARGSESIRIVRCSRTTAAARNQTCKLCSRSSREPRHPRIEARRLACNQVGTQT